MFLSMNLLAQKIDMNKLLDPTLQQLKEKYPLLRNNTLKIEDFKINLKKESIDITMSKITEGIPYREDIVSMLYDSVRAALPEPFNGYDIFIYASKYKIEDLIPNYYREKNKVDKTRIPKKYSDEDPIVKNVSKPFCPSKGLYGRHIAMWHSHGYYFECSKAIWQWQRPYLFGVTEDTYTMSYTLQFLIPMLENAGAYIFTPRERDCQLNEVIVDNDTLTSLCKYTEFNGPKYEWKFGEKDGFAHRQNFYQDGENPFKKGTYRQCLTSKKGGSTVEWVPYIPEKGEYAVYVSYKTLENSATDAHYSVYHLGGCTNFVINQKMGGGTWIYLGKFAFDKGNASGRVVLTNESGESNKIVTADAVRFGGGMGNIARAKEPSPKAKGKDKIPMQPVISNMPRYLEGARYWLQWAGYDSSLYIFQRGSDYKDDYVSRSRWVNALAGGSIMLPQAEGKNIPIDISFGFHTDAGLLNKDSIIGTMGIYMTETNDGIYKNGQNRLTSRDLTDMISTHICEDICAKYRENWTRRKLVDASYFEAREPEVPTILLELLSHQNFTDMKYGLDPNFRFDVCRSIYKAILKYLAFQYGLDYVIQPLPVCNFSTEFYDSEKTSVFLRWKDTQDTLEPTAQASKYVLYTAIEDGGFDNGVVLTEPHAIVPIEKGKIYRFKVTAANDGGESFPSEILSVCNTGTNAGKTVMIVNGFRRVAAPDYFDNGAYAGFLYETERGINYGTDLGYTGAQYDFLKKSKYKTNIVSGFGASSADFESKPLAGNTFDYSYIHGASIRNAGYSFVSISKDAFNETKVSPKSYFMVDMILGEEKETISGKTKRYHIFDEPTRNVLSSYLSQKGSLMLTGSYLASDVWMRDSICDDEEIQFVEKKLKYTYDGREVNTDGKLSNFFCMRKEFQNSYQYSTSLNSDIYSVLSPDAIKPINGATEILNFSDNRISAIAFNGKYRLYVSTIPFETILTSEARDTYMSELISFFNSKW